MDTPTSKPAPSPLRPYKATKYATALLSNFVIAEQSRSHEDTYRMIDEVSNDELISPSELGWLGTQMSLACRTAVANHPNTPPEVLHDLATSQSLSVRVSALMNPSIPTALLLTAWKQTLRYVALNRDRLNTNPDTTARPLSITEDEWERAENATLVRFAVAENPTSPPQFLNSLARLEKDERVLSALAQNPSTPPEGLMLVAYGSPNYPLVRMAVAQNPRTDTGTLMFLVDDDNPHVLSSVAYHPNTPQAAKDALQALGH